jgi:hypothetical protein
MKFYEREEDMPFGEIKKEDGTVHHLHCNGSRRHILDWDANGRHCSVKECEINKKQS